MAQNKTQMQLREMDAQAKLKQQQQQTNQFYQKPN